jgi:hypothetical protein
MSSSTNLSQRFLHSRENMFRSEIVLQSVDFRFLRWRHPQLLSEALRRSLETRGMAASHWTEFEILDRQGRYWVDFLDGHRYWSVMRVLMKAIYTTKDRDSDDEKIAVIEEVDGDVQTVSGTLPMIITTDLRYVI